MHSYHCSRVPVKGANALPNPVVCMAVANIVGHLIVRVDMQGKGMCMQAARPASPPPRRPAKDDSNSSASSSSEGPPLLVTAKTRAPPAPHRVLEAFLHMFLMGGKQQR